MNIFFTSAHDHLEVSATRLSSCMTSKVHLVISHPKKCLPVGSQIDARHMRLRSYFINIPMSLKMPVGSYAYIYFSMK